MRVVLQVSADALILAKSSLSWAAALLSGGRPLALRGGSSAGKRRTFCVAVVKPSICEERLSDGGGAGGGGDACSRQFEDLRF